MNFFTLLLSFLCIDIHTESITQKKPQPVPYHNIQLSSDEKLTASHIQQFLFLLSQSSYIVQIIIDENSNNIVTPFSDKLGKKLHLLIAAQNHIHQRVLKKPHKFYENLSIVTHASQETIKRWHDFVTEGKVKQERYAQLQEINKSLMKLLSKVAHNRTPITMYAAL